MSICCPYCGKILMSTYSVDIGTIETVYRTFTENDLNNKFNKLLKIINKINEELAKIKGNIKVVNNNIIRSKTLSNVSCE